MRRFAFLLAILVLSAFSCNNLADNEFLTLGEMNIYLAEEGQIQQNDSDTVDFSNLKLESEPWLKDNNIDFYDWSAHIFYLKNKIEKEDCAGRYFVLKYNEKPLFLGYFMPMWQSSIPRVPAIISEDGVFYPSDVVALNGFHFLQEGNSLTTNEEFKAALKLSGFFRNGIDVSLENVKKKNSTTIEYTYRVANRDSRKIYVLDPDKMGASRFHYYTNGVWFRSGNTGFFPEDFSPAPSEKILPGWYYALYPGRSITRTVELGGFRNMPSGKVTCMFSFPGAKVQSGEWEKRDGRVWLGEFYTEKEMEID